MPIIELSFKILAPVERCFDLSRSIDLHKISTSKTREEAIAGVTSGLIGLNQTVTWRATHFGVRQQLTSKITEFERPFFFVDEMVTGAFKSFRHTHRFESKNDFTLMIDTFDYTSPLGVLGRFADALFLKNYMTRLLKERNMVIKSFAETNGWQRILNE